MPDLAYAESSLNLPKTVDLLLLETLPKHVFKTDAMASWVAALRLKAKSRGAYSQPSSTPINGKRWVKYSKITNRGSMG